MPDRAHDRPRRPARWLTAANLVFAALCLTAAALQHNDPDPLPWVALYGGAATAAVAALHLRGGWRAALVVAAIAATWAAITWSGVLGQVEGTDLWRRMSDKGGKVEEYREAGGLTLVAAWLLAVGVAGRRAAPP